MCNTSLQQRAFNNVVEPFSFSTFQLLRTCNRLLLPNADAPSYYSINKETDQESTPVVNTSNGDSSAYNTSVATPTPANSPILDVMDTISLSNVTTTSDVELNVSNSTKSHEMSEKSTHSIVLHPESTTAPFCNESYMRNATSAAPTLPMPIPSLTVLPLGGNTLLSNKPTLPGFEYITPTSHAINASDFSLMELNRVGVFPGFMHRRPRGEKRPIPDEQKDEKYYERRKRNNEAAKKSRDARKIREDRIAFRAAILEQENSILRAQVMTLRDELRTLRQLISGTSTSLLGRDMQQI